MSFEARLLDTSKTTAEQKAEILKYAADTRKFEIERFWQRSLFFWGFIGAAFVAYATLYDKDKLLPLLVACFGLVCSVAWSLQNRGSKYWQEAWEQKVIAVENDVLGVPLSSNPERIQPKGFWGAARFSVSKMAIALSDFTILIWIALGIFVFPISATPKSACLSYATVGVTLIYIAALFVGGHSVQTIPPQSK